MFVPIAKDPSGEMKHLAARQTSLYFLLQVFKSSYNEKVILHNEKQELQNTCKCLSRVTMKK